MAFPPVIVETAFGGEEDETLYAVGGWSDITSWVKSATGPLRGRTYETNQTEAGQLSVTLDNLDGRFSPNRLSPYWPNVTPNKRFRIRGLNMVAPNIARGGGADRSTALFQLPFWDNFALTDKVKFPYTWVSHSASPPVGLPAELTDHIEITVNTGATNYQRLVAWIAPIEVATRLTHSGYIWKVSGTEPGASTSQFEMWYFDTNDVPMMAEFRPVDAHSPTASTPVRYTFSHAPFGAIKYAMVCVSVFFDGVSTMPVTYALTGVQTEVPDNLAPNVSARYDRVHWQTVGGTETITRDTGSSSANLAWNGSTAMFQRIPRLVPGDTYSVAVEVFKTGVGPDIQLTADDGVTGPILTAENVWTTMRTQFVATRVTNDIKFIPQTPATLGDILRVRSLNVKRVDDPALPLGSDTEIAAWSRPLDVFEGWVEEWPWKVQEANMSITVVDRLSRIGGIDLANTLPEALDLDKPELVIPFNDDPTATSVSWSGNWVEPSKVPQIPFSASKGSLVGTNYSLGIAGPTDEPAIDWNPSAPMTAGYFIEVPYSRVVTPPPSQPPTPPAPPAPVKTQYSKTWFSTWSRTFNGTDNLPRFDDTPFLYQGTFDGSNGNYRALVGFNSQDMQAVLAGAEILEVFITLRNYHWRWNNGEAVRVGTHGYASKPGSYTAGNVITPRWTQWYNYGQWRSFYVEAQLGYEIAAGTARGISIGPGRGGGAPNDDYGIFYGATHGPSYQPSITVTWRK